MADPLAERTISPWRVMVPDAPAGRRRLRPARPPLAGRLDPRARAGHRVAADREHPHRRARRGHPPEPGALRGRAARPRRAHLPPDHRLRPGDGLPLRPRSGTARSSPRPGATTSSRSSACTTRPRTSRRRPCALPGQLAAVHPRRRRRQRRRSTRPSTRTTTRRSTCRCSGAAQRLADPLPVPPQHGRHGLHVDLAAHRRPAGGA